MVPEKAQSSDECEKNGKIVKAAVADAKMNSENEISYTKVFGNNTILRYTPQLNGVKDRIHEIGHALKLKHPYASIGDSDNTYNQMILSVMNQSNLSNGAENATSYEISPFDIWNLQQRWGG